MQCSPKGGVNSPKEGVTFPQATKFTNSEGKVAQYFFKNNPWKLSDCNEFQKIFRFCLICGDNRFSDKEWSGILDVMWGAPPTICRKSSCWDDLAYLSGFVPEKHYFVKTALDKSRTSQAHTQEVFEDIEEVTSLVRFDKVFKDESEMPKEYVETFKKLENFPVEMRTSKIDSIYFSFKEEHNIEVGEYLTDTSDPFLRSLAEYRQKSIAILQDIRKSSI